MPPVFAHGRLRLYLLKLLDEAPRHGYEVIRLLEERFQGLYAPSAGTVYPRLAKLEAEGLVRHTSEGGRKVYSITDAGRAELAGRRGELADLEQEIRDSVSELAAEIRADVRGAAGRLRSEMRAAAGETRRTADRPGGGQEGEAWRVAKEELRRAQQEWREQARRARDESRRAREEAQAARRQAEEAQDRARREMQRVAQQVQEHLARGDWPAGVREGLADLTTRLGGLFGAPGNGTAAPGTGAGKDSGPATGSGGGSGTGTPTGGGSGSGGSGSGTGTGTGTANGSGGGTGSGTATASTAAGPRAGSQGPYEKADPAAGFPAWAAEPGTGGDPARELERLLDRLRDEVRDAARDHGVSEAQLTEARHHLGTAAARLTALLRPGA
ncbi:helix-turn-helix transcriptional regulator [Streptomyces fradiae]|uniref:PadR family transcriptional regulator n=1 Tax=Streptomyces fradiae TaxID=1906 RepID=UPI0036B767F2